MSGIYTRNDELFYEKLRASLSAYFMSPQGRDPQWERCGSGVSRSRSQKSYKLDELHWATSVEIG
jgi:hypothetical protein